MFWKKKNSKETEKQTKEHQINENNAIDIKDIEEAIEHYKSTPEEIDLLYAAGMAYLNGEYNAIPDKDKALCFFSRASILGHIKSKHLSGQLFILKGLNDNDSITFAFGVSELCEAYKKGCAEARDDLQDIVNSGFFENVSSVEDLCAISETNNAI